MVEKDLDYLIKAPINICTKTFPSIILLGLVTTEIIRILCAKFSIKIEISIHVAESTTVCFDIFRVHICLLSRVNTIIFINLVSALEKY